MQAKPISHYWVRLKPCNPKRGHKLQRLHYLGRIWTGGDGFTPGCIPEWVRVNIKQAGALKTLRQDGSTIGDTPKAFDICTEEQKTAIDMKEEDFRRSMMGYGRPSIAEMPDVAAASVDLGSKAAQRRLTMDDLEDSNAVDLDAESVLSTDDGDEGGLGGIAGATAPHAIEAPSTDLSLPDVSGRSAAAEGFEEVGSFDMNDGQDVDEVAPRSGKAPIEMPVPLPVKASKVKTSRQTSRRAK